MESVMRRIVFSLIVCCTLWFGFCNMIDFSNSYIIDLHENQVQMDVIFPDDMDNENRLHLILNAAKKTDAVIFCEYTSFDSFFQTTYTVYSTSIKTASSNYNSDFRKIKFPFIFFKINMYPLMDCMSSQMEMPSVFFADCNHYKEFVKCLQSEGITANKIAVIQESSYSTHQWDTVQIYFIFIVCLGIGYLIVRNSKLIAIKQMNGYSIGEIIKTEYLNFYYLAAGCSCAIFLFVFLLNEFIFECGIQFIFYSLCSYLFFIFIFLTAITITMLIAIKGISFSGLKNYSSAKYVYFFGIVSKSLLLVLFVMFGGSVVSQSNTVYQLKKTSDLFAKEEIFEYKVFEFNSASYDISSHEDDIRTKIMNLYDGIEENCEIVLINGRNYLIDSRVNDEAYNFYVTPNYFNFSSVKSGNGTYFASDDFSDRKSYILIPEYLKNEKPSEQIVIEYKNIFKNNVDIVVKYYPGNQDVPSYNPYVGSGKTGYIEDPVIIVADLKLYKDEAEMIYSSLMSDFLVINGEEDILLDHIKNSDLEIVISNLKTIRAIFHETMRNAETELFQSLFQFIVIFIVFVQAVWICTEMYFDSNSRELMVRKVNGYSSFNLYIAPVLVPKLIFYLALGGFLRLDSLGFSILLLAFGIECIFLRKCIHNFGKQVIPLILKGKVIQ